MPPRLHVVSIRPEMGADEELNIKLVVAGESRERALELVRKMEARNASSRPRFDQETVEVRQTPGDNVQFDISAVYIPEVPGAGKGSSIMPDGSDTRKKLKMTIAALAGGGLGRRCAFCCRR